MKKTTLKFISCIITTIILLTTNVPIFNAIAKELNTQTWSDENVEITYTLVNHWNNQYQVDAIVKNLSDANIEDWCIAYAANMEISNIWNASIESNENIHFIHNMGHNQDIAPHESVKFGFISITDNFIFPECFQLISAPKQVEEDEYKTEFSIINDWETGYTAAFTITNISNRTFEDWYISFDWSENIDTIWNAKILGKENNHYDLFNASYNQNIAVGESVTICLQNHYNGNINVQPGNIQLFEYGKNRKNALNSINNSKYVSIDTSSFENYDENSFLIDKNCETLYGKLAPGLHAVCADYTIKNAWDTIIAQGTFNPNSNWNVDNVGFVLGMNLVTINVYYDDGDKSATSVWFMNTYEDNMSRTNVDTIDSDGDLLNNYIESIYGTDSEKVDTDGDELTDYQELMETGTNPLIVDSDADSVLDGRTDDDHDGIDDITEYSYGTDPFCVDSDGDHLTDYKELFETMTDPLNKDTDNDGAPDSWEIMHNTDPLVFDDAFCVTFTVDGFDCQADLTVETDDGSISTLNAKISDSSLLSPDIPGYVCNGFDFSIDKEFKSAHLRLTFNESLLNDSEFVPSIYYLNEESQKLEEIETQWDGKSNQVDADLKHFSTYILLNKTKFDEAFKKDIELPEEKRSVPFEFVFAIDCSGSMGHPNGAKNDPQNIRLKVAKEFIDKFDDKDIGAVVSFGDKANVLCDFTNNKQSLKEAVDQVGCMDGHTCIGAAIDTSISLFSNSDDKIKYIILLTDGESTDELSANYAQNAKNKQIQIITIGLGRGVDEPYLRKIANNTAPDGEKGLYYFASIANDLESTYNQIRETVKKDDPYRDSNGDNITDAQTLAFCEGRLTTSMGKNPFLGYTYDEIQGNKDIDGDGILNGDELSIDKSTVNSTQIKMYSEPTDADTDGDGYSDSIEKKNGTDPYVFNISTDDMYNILCDNDKYMASNISRDYLENTGIMIKLYLGNALFNFKLQNITNYEKALGTYIGILTDNAARMDFENMIEDMVNSEVGIALNFLYKLSEKIPDVASVPMDTMQYNNYLNLISELESDLLKYREFKLHKDSFKYGPELYEEVLKNMEAIQKNLGEIVEKAEKNFNITGMEAYKTGKLLESFPVKLKNTRKVTEVLNETSEVANKAGYVFIAIDHTKNAISQGWALASVISVGNQYDTVDEFLTNIFLYSGNYELQDAALNLSMMMENKWKCDLGIFISAIDEIALSGGAEMLKTYALGKCGPIGMAIDLGLTIGDAIFNVSSLSTEIQATIAYGDASVTLAEELKYRTRRANDNFLNVDDKYIDLLSALIQLRIVGENQFYVASEEKKVSIEKMFKKLHKEVLSVLKDNVDSVYAVSEKAPRLYSTKEFSGSKLKDTSGV